jgi:hypothetical protein
MTAFRRAQEVIAAAGIPDGPHACPKGLRHGFIVQAVSRGIAPPRLTRGAGRIDENPARDEKKLLSLREDFTGSAGDDAAGATGGSPDGHKPTDPTKPDGPKR